MRRILVVDKDTKKNSAAKLSQALNFFGYNIEVQPTGYREYHADALAFENRNHGGKMLIMVWDDEKKSALWAGWDPSMVEVAKMMNRFFLFSRASV